MSLLQRARSVALTASLAVLAGLGSTAHAAFVEDFSTFANGVQEDNKLSLGGAGAQTNGWTFVNPRRFSVESGGVAQHTGGGTISEKTAGKAHGLDLGGATRIDISFDVALKNADHDIKSIAQFWLSDASQNGYGITIERNAAGNALYITKLHDGTAAFGAERNATQVHSQDSAAYLAEGAGISLETLHLTIERSTPGGEVVLTAWSEGIDGSSYASPLVRVVDTGAAGPFDSAVLDLGGLDHAAFGLSRYYSSGGGARIDNIRIEAVIPEPASAALLGLGGAVMLARGRAAN